MTTFALVTYLSLDGGGYDIVVRSDAGVVVWWIVLLCALAGILPARIGAPGWIAVGLLAGFAAWTGLAIGWSQSAEQSVIEVGRVAAYLGVLVLVIAVQGRTAARHTVNGLTCAIGLVTVLAVLSRLHPQAFTPNAHFQFLGPTPARKLSYPLNYWNALADFAAMGVPLLLAAAIGARTIAGRALAAATLPLSAVCVYLTVSRGGVLALGLGIAVFLALVPRRLETVATLLVSGVGAAILLRATSQRPALTSGVPSHLASHQGTQLLWLGAIICFGVALLQILVGRVAGELARPGALAPDRRATTKRALALAAAALVVAVAAGVPSRLEHAWHDFKQPSGVIAPTSDSNLFSRLQAANGNSRYQFWQSAINANATHPWRGIGPGTFQFWWTQHANAPGFIRNAHSLYFETLAETGIIGFALLAGLLLWFVGVAVGRSLREPPAARLWIAAASASLAVFLFSAALEWVWQLAAMAAAALVLGAVIVAGRHETPAGRENPQDLKNPQTSPDLEGVKKAPKVRRLLGVRDGLEGLLPRFLRNSQSSGDSEGQHPQAQQEPEVSRAHRSEAPMPTGAPGSARFVPRAVLGLLAVVALGAVLVPLSGQLAIRDSQAAAADGQLAAALRDSLAAQRLQPYAASAYLQEALVLEGAGELGPAAAAAEVATTDSPTDWTTWLTLARIDARRGATSAAVVALRRARQLNPRSSLFAPS